MAKKTENIIAKDTEKAEGQPEATPEPKKAKVTTMAKYHIVIFQEKRDDMLDRNLVSKIQGLLDDKVTTPQENTQIDVWLDSPGGSADAAYKLVLDLRSRCVKLWTIVPDYAKSAATLMVLGADCIFMSPAAELGPLDVQIEHPDRENTTISGLDVTNSLEYLMEAALDFALVGGRSVLRFTGLPRHEVLHELLQFMARFMEPVISKLDPHIIHKATNELKVAEEYALRMLKMRNLDGNNQMDTKTAKSLLKRLVKDYPTHGFVISRTEAKELGLPVICAVESYERWKQVKALYTYSSREGKTIIDVVLDSDLDKKPETNIEEVCNGTTSKGEAESETKGV